jgi:hypothetical protein
MPEHPSQDLAVRILEKDHERVIVSQARDGHVVQGEPVLDDLLEVVRGVGLDHNLQGTHGSPPFSHPDGMPERAWA